MRVTVNQLRILLVVVNMALPVSLILFYAYRRGALDVALVYLGMKSPPDASADDTPKIYRDPSVFRFVETERRLPAGNQVAALARVAGYLQPRKDEPIVDDTNSDDTTKEEEDASDDEVLEGGPLAKDWEYFWGIQYHDNPTLNRVYLRKKAPETPKSSALARYRSSRRTIPTRTRTSSRTSRTSRYKAPNQEISFTVADRYFKDEELELEFYIHAATADELVYWLSGKPKEKYALKRVHDSNYLEVGREERLLGSKEEDEEKEGEEDKKNFIKILPADYVNLKEKDYRQLEKGRPGLQVLEPKSSATFSKSPFRRTTPTSSAIRRSIGATSTRTSSTTSTSSKPKSREEQLKELQKTLKNPKIPESAKQKLREALHGKKK